MQHFNKIVLVLALTIALFFLLAACNVTPEEKQIENIQPIGWVQESSNVTCTQVFYPQEALPRLLAQAEFLDGKGLSLKSLATGEYWFCVDINANYDAFHSQQETNLAHYSSYLNDKASTQSLEERLNWLLSFIAE